MSDRSNAHGPASAADEQRKGLYGSSAPKSAQRRALASGDLPVAVYGLGKMGLPLATVYAETTTNVIGVDVDPGVVEAISSGRCHVRGEPGLTEGVQSAVEADWLEATTNGPHAASRARIHVIIVPTLLDDANEPDLATVESVAADIAAGLTPGDLVIAESTLPPGTCRDVLRPHLAEQSGLEPDEFGLAFCPERTSSGTALRDIRGQYPKVVGGVDEESTRAAALVYDELSSNDVHRVSDATTAEAVKVFEGIYRDVNIGLANELTRACDSFGISVREAINTANDLPMCDLHDPGPGVGGHCIPFYPHFVLSQVDSEMPVTRAARRVNESMPAFTVARLERALEGDGITLGDATVAVLGLTYRPGVEETRASPAIGVIEELTDRGATVYGLDPLVDPATFGARPLEISELGEASLDAAVLVTPHEEFDRVDWSDLESMVVVDGRDAIDFDDEAFAHHRGYTLGGPRRDGAAVDKTVADGGES